MRARYQNNPWIQRIFESAQAKNGGIVRRNAKDVQKFASESELREAAQSRGFHMLRHGSQYLILCSKSGFYIEV